MDVIFALRMMIEKYREGQKELHCVFMDPEKDYDRVPRLELWNCMRQAGVTEKYIRAVQYMYGGCETVVRCAAGLTKPFKVRVGLHQGSTLGPLLFAIVMDQLTGEVRNEPPWSMMFADEIVLVRESREEIEQDLERWRNSLERIGMNVSRTNTEYLCANEHEVRFPPVTLGGAEVTKVEEFKYLGSTVQADGGCTREIRKRVKAGWYAWRKLSGMLCDKRVPARVKGKIHQTVVRPSMMHGLETVGTTKNQEAELDVAEMKMLRFALGVTRKDRIKNEHVCGTVKVGQISRKVTESRLQWY